MFRRLCLVLFACLFAARHAAAQNQASSFAREADAYIRKQVDSGGFSGSVLIAWNGRPLLRKAYGLANRELNVPAKPETEYQIGSTTKTFTAVAVLQLVQAGKLSLSDSLARFIPDAPVAWRDITIAHLLSHESGLPEYTATTNSFRALVRTERTPSEILGLIRNLPLRFVPGSRYEYNNSDYVALGLVIEAVGGEDYESYVTRHILQPLHMAHTGFLHVQALIPDRASGYMKGKGGWENAFYIDPSMLFAAGSMYSDVDDLLVWDQAIHANRLLSPALREEMFKDRGHGYGLGFFIDSINGKAYVGHGGSLPGFVGDFERFRDWPLTIIFLSNTYPAQVEKMTRELAVLYGTLVRTAPEEQPAPNQSRR